MTDHIEKLGQRANTEMVQSLILWGAIAVPEVAQAFLHTPRHHFIEEVYCFDAKAKEWRKLALDQPGERELQTVYSDRALVVRVQAPTPGAMAQAVSSSSQPSLMAEMIQDALVQPGHNVLEIGTGTGYNAALLGWLVRPGGSVHTLDIEAQVVGRAHEHLSRYADRPVHIYHRDGRFGLPEHAPYDRIVVTASAADLEPAWLEQLAPGGLLQAPVHFAPGLCFVVRGTVHDGVFTGHLTRPAYFIPLQGTPHDWEITRPAPWQRYRAQPPPWGKTFSGRGAQEWLRFVLSLGFFAWLKGHQVQYRELDGRTALELDYPGGQKCLLGHKRWLLECDPDTEGACRTVYEDFLRMAAPRPTEYRCRVAPEPASAVHQAFAIRKLPYFVWSWELFSRRERAWGY